MEVQNKEMFHYHRGRYYNDIWKAGNEIIVDENFNNRLGVLLQRFDISVVCKNGNLTVFDSVISTCLENLESQSLEYIAKVMNKARELILEMSIYNRELALERYRLKYCPQLPSRLHSLYFCEQEGLDFWKNQLGESCNLQLFRVSLDGELFCSSDYWLPGRDLCVEQMEQEAGLYWNPPYTETSDQEYLFRGKVKVIEKLCIPDDN